jgi:hypothetical protein
VVGEGGGREQVPWGGGQEATTAAAVQVDRDLNVIPTGVCVCGEGYQSARLPALITT